MSKRDSIVAQLPRLEDMAEEMQIEARHTYAETERCQPTQCRVDVHIPPDLMTRLPSHTMEQPHQSNLPYMMGHQSVLHPRECRTQTVHTIKFQRIGHGDAPSELKVEETDVEGFVRYKSLEHNFFGILNHGDYHATPWQNSTYPANYWRKFFEVDTEGATFPDYS